MGSDGEEALASVTELVGSLTHSLKGLLNGLEGGLYLVESGRRKEDPDRIGQGLEMVSRNALRLKNLVMHVLYYVKDRPISPCPAELSRLCSTALAAVAPLAGQLGVELESRVEGGSVTLDPLAAVSLLVDLLETSLDACSASSKGLAHKITLSGRVGSGEEAVLEVQHTGVSMDEENRKRALSMYYKPRGGDRTAHAPFIACKIARSHGGTLAVDPVPQGGERFVVALPARKREVPWPAGGT
jgi:two-component system NtrC family sensor kinase